MDSTFFNVFSVKFLEGEAATSSDSKPNSLIITEDMAKKYFGYEEPMGKILIAESISGIG